jgi:hypothetical protein
MQTFTYSFFWKFVYRYGNLFISMLLIFYIIPLALNIDHNLILILPFIVSLFLLYYINKSYFTFYKLVPFKIETDDEKIVCTNFLFRGKSVTIYYKDIESLSGGIFEAKYRGLMKICDGKNRICIGFFERMKNSSKLVTLILSKVDKKIYDEIINTLELVKIKQTKKSE